MGNQLTTPKLEKEIQSFDNSMIQISACSIQGWRNEMEDRVIIEELSSLDGHYLFGVFDGHGGDMCARYISNVFMEIFTANRNFLMYNLKFSGNYDADHVAYAEYNELIIRALTETCYEIDQMFNKTHVQTSANRSGTTMNLVFVTPYFIFCTNVGDSRSVMGINRTHDIIFSSTTGYEETQIPTEKQESEDEIVVEEPFPLDDNEIIVEELPSTKPDTDKRLHCIAIVCIGDSDYIQLSNDHKPTNLEESERIHRAGCFVVSGRVNGNLALSRAFGDFEFKNPMIMQHETAVTCAPQITITPRKLDDDYIVCACDGLWDVMSSKDVIEYIRSAESSCKDLEELTSYLVDEAFHRGSSDNISIIICKLK